jgi:hypothetical protein
LGGDAPPADRDRAPRSHARASGSELNTSASMACVPTRNISSVTRINADALNHAMTTR